MAADFLARLAAGEEPELETWAATFRDEVERAAFHEYVKDALIVENSLPLQLRSGALLGSRWRLVRELGSGQLGKVFSAIDQFTGRQVAVKVLAAFAADGCSGDSRFLREARALAAFGHPDIAAVREVQTDGPFRFLVTDLVEGQSLAWVLDRVRAGAGRDSNGLLRAPPSGRALADAIRNPDKPARATRLDARSWWRSVARLLADASATVAAAHACGVVHRGLKSENLMLRADGSVVVLDFCLAGALDPAGVQLTREFFGSTASAAPEHARSLGAEVDPRHDIYQLGLIMYELLTLRRPFRAASAAVMLEQISLGDITPPTELDPRVPPELEAICLKAADVIPERRYQTMLDCHDDLQRFLEGRVLPLAVRDGRAPRRALRMKYALRRHRAALFVGGAALLAASLALWFRAH